jgi:hypothetical protein
MYEKVKLSIELIPYSTWGKNLRSILIQDEWDIVRKWCYKQANHRCEICGNKGKMECHERWGFNRSKRKQILLGVICLCSLCHKAKHLGRTQAVHPDLYSKVVHHIKEVNKWTDDEFKKYLKYIQDEYQKYGTKYWRLDITWIEQFILVQKEQMK